MSALRSSRRGIWLCVLSIGLVVAGVSALFWLLGADQADKISSGIGAACGVIAVVISIFALTRRPTPPAPAPPRTSQPTPTGPAPSGGGNQWSGAVDMHVDVKDNGNANVQGQGEQHNYRRTDQ